MDSAKKGLSCIPTSIGLPQATYAHIAYVTLAWDGCPHVKAKTLVDTATPLCKIEPAMKIMWMEIVGAPHAKVAQPRVGLQSNMCSLTQCNSIWQHLFSTYCSHPHGEALGSLNFITFLNDPLVGAGVPTEDLARYPSIFQADGQGLPFSV